MAYPNFTWGALDSSEFTELLDTAFDEVVSSSLEKELFQSTPWQCRQGFTNELAHLFHAFATGSALAASVLPLLLLQKPFPKPKQRDHISCLER